MAVNYRNKNRDSAKPGVSITHSQRSSCAVLIHRFDDLSITKIRNINASNDKSIAGHGSTSTRGNLKTRSQVVIRNDVIRCNIMKNKEGSSGTFSINLKRGKKVSGGKIQPEDINYLDVIHPGDWIMIYLKKSGPISREEIGSTKPSSGFKFLGIIENVRYVEVDSPERAFPRLEYIVTGRDFGKIFDMSIFFNPLLNTQTMQTLLGAHFLSDSNKTIKPTALGSPDKIIKRLVSFYLGGTVDKLNVNNQAWYIPRELGITFKSGLKTKPGGISFVDILDTSKIGIHKFSRGRINTSLNSLPGRALVKSLPATGTVWSILQHMQNAAINEMYTELTLDSKGNLKPTLVVRQLPFSNKAEHETNVYTLNKQFNKENVSDSITRNEKTFFVDLPILEIQSSDIRQKNVGKSEHERLNHVIVVPKIDTTVYDLLYVTGINTPSIQRYGLKSFQAQTSYVLDNTKDGIKSYCMRCVNLIQDWFFTSHQFFNGTIVIDGINEHVEVGSNVRIKDTNQLYHIEGYTHTYEIVQNAPIKYDIELRVSRGQIYDGRSAKFISRPNRSTIEPTTIVTTVLEGTRD